MAVYYNGVAVAPSKIVMSPTDFSEVTVQPEFVLKGKKFYDETGTLREGEGELLANCIDVSQDWQNKHI